MIIDYNILKYYGKTKEEAKHICERRIRENPIVLEENYRCLMNSVMHMEIIAKLIIISVISLTVGTYFNLRFGTGPIMITIFEVASIVIIHRLSTLTARMVLLELDLIEIWIKESGKGA